MKTVIKRIAIVLSSFSACAAVMNFAPDTPLSTLSAVDAGYMVLAMIISLPGVLAMFHFGHEKSALLKEKLLDVLPTLVGSAFLLCLLWMMGRLEALWIGGAFVLAMCFFALVTSLGRWIKPGELR